MTKKIKAIKATTKKELDNSNEVELVRVTFTMPQPASEAIDALRKHVVKEDGDILARSEVVRMGIQALQSMPANKLKSLLAELERYKPGRRKKRNSPEI